MSLDAKDISEIKKITEEENFSECKSCAHQRRFEGKVNYCRHYDEDWQDWEDDGVLIGDEACEEYKEK